MPVRSYSGRPYPPSFRRPEIDVTRATKQHRHRLRLLQRRLTRRRLSLSQFLRTSAIMADAIASSLVTVCRVGWTSTKTPPGTSYSGATGLNACLRQMFATFGVPENLSSDGGPEFTDSETDVLSQENPSIRPMWRDAWSAKETALPARFARTSEALNTHWRALPAREYVQNQRVPNPNKWDTSGVVVDVGDKEQYLFKIDGSGRLTLRNIRFLRQYVQSSTCIGKPLSYRCPASNDTALQRRPDTMPATRPHPYHAATAPELHTLLSYASVSCCTETPRINNASFSNSHCARDSSIYRNSCRRCTFSNLRRATFTFTST